MQQTRRMIRQKHEATGGGLTPGLVKPQPQKRVPSVSLDKIVTEYLRKQHAVCRNPVVTCPMFSLLTWVLFLIHFIYLYCNKVKILGDRGQRVSQLPELQWPRTADNMLSPWRRLLPARHKHWQLIRARVWRRAVSENTKILVFPLQSLDRMCCYSIFL